MLEDDLSDDGDQLRKDRPWDQGERQDHAERHKQRTKKSTAKQYKPQVNAFKTWCAENNCSSSVVGLSDVPKVASFFEEYCSGSWLPGTGGRNRKSKGLGNDGAMNLHSALMHYVKCCCIEEGVEELDLKQDPGYLVYYRQYAGNRGLTRKHDVQGQFTKEDHLTIARAAYAIGDCFKMLLISLAIAVVSRGDEIRDLQLKHMKLKKNDAIGPASCWTIQYGLGDRKVNNGKPEQKVFIRNRVPEACPMGWMGQHFHKRFKLDKERLPPPGSNELDSVFLFPGRNAGTPISYTQHKAYIDKLLLEQEILTDKSTHVARVYAAELMNAMGVDVTSIGYAGGWRHDSLGTAYIVFGCNPQALLALGMWRSDRVDFNCYWQPRMRIGVPVELVWHAMPQLEDFMKQVVAAVAAGDKSHADAARHKHLARVLYAVITIAIQDAIELADTYPHNPFIADMNQHPLFRHYVRYYKAYKEMGGFEKERPIPLREHLNKLDNMLTQLVHGRSNNRLISSSSNSSGSSSDGGNMHPFQADTPGSYGADWADDEAQDEDDEQQEDAAEQQQHQQQQPSTAGDIDSQTNGGYQREQQQQQQPQSDPASGAAGHQFSNNGRQSQEQQEQQSQQRDNSAGGSQTGVGGAEQQQQQQQGRQPPQPSAAGIFCTPGGHQRSMAECRSVFTPEGDHYGSFWIPDQQTPFSQEPAPPQQQYRYPLQRHQQPAVAPAGQEHQQQHGQQQQQQRCELRGTYQQPRHTEPAGADSLEYVQLVQKQIALLQAQLQGMPPGTVEALALIQEIKILLAEVKEHTAASMQQPQEQQPGRQQQQRRQQQFMQRYGVAGLPGGRPGMMRQDPIEDMMEPGINSDPAFQEALGSRLGGLKRPDPAAATLDYIDYSMQESMQKCLPGALAQALQQCGLAAGVGSTNAAASAGAAATGSGAAEMPAPNPARQPGGQPNKAAAAAPQIRAVPFMKDQKSLSDLVAWYTKVQDIPYEQADGSTVMRSRSEMRELGNSWVDRKYSQRAAEYDVIYDRLKAHAVELTIKTGQPKTVEDAVAHVVATESVKGGITISKYQKACSAWRKAQKAATAAARAEAEAAAESTAEDTDSQQEGDSQREGGGGDV